MRPGCIRLVVSGGERLNWRASCDNLIIIIFRILLELQNSKLFLKIKNNNNNTCNSVLHVLLYAKNFLLEHNINKITMESDSPYRKTYVYILNFFGIRPILLYYAKSDWAYTIEWVYIYSMYVLYVY